MWVFNIIRDLYRNRNYDIVPEKIAFRDEDWEKTRDKFAFENFHRPNEKQACILKCHMKLQAIRRSDEMVFTTLRDPRDCLASYARFMEVNTSWLEENWRDILQTHVNFMIYITSSHKNRLTLLPYQDIKERPGFVIEKVTDALGTSLEPDDLVLIEKYSKENVKHRIEMEQKNHEKGHKGDGQFFTTPFECKRYVDYKTGFQTNHVSEYQDGAWKEMLPNVIVDNITQFLAPYLDAYGFPQ